MKHLILKNRKLIQILFTNFIHKIIFINKIEIKRITNDNIII